MERDRERGGEDGMALRKAGGRVERMKRRATAGIGNNGCQWNC
jgi:hypothetical protein